MNEKVCNSVYVILECAFALELLPELGVYYLANDGTIWLFLHSCFKKKKENPIKSLVECIFVSH